MHGLRVLLGPNGRGYARVTCEHRESGEPFCLSEEVRELLPSLFENGEQLSNIVHVWELHVALNQQCFDCLLYRLLRIEAQVLQVDALALRTGQCQVTPGSV